jgi:6-phosphogluconolactonase (cycloisomerase 2 family)
LSSNATFFDPQATITILDDDRPPAISVSDVQVTEGDGGTVQAQFQLSTTRPIPQAVTVNFATADGTATVADSDYQPNSGQASFAPMTTATTVNVQVVGDLDDEQDENFVLNLSGASLNATIADNQAVGTIYDDDGFLTFVEAEPLGDLEALWGVSGLAVAPDGSHVYSTGRFADAVAVFGRNPTSGELGFLEAVADGDVQGATTIDGLDGAGAVVISPDGAHVYVTGFNDGAVSVFSRNAGSGLLTYVESERDASLGGAADGLLGATSLAISADGSHLYVASFTDDAVALFTRDTNPLSATFGQLAYSAAVFDNVGGVNGLDGASSVRIAPGGAHVYVSAAVDNAVAVFARHPSTGLLTFVEAKSDGVGGVNGLEGAAGVAVSVDGGQVYVTGAGEDALATFSRNNGTGALTFQSMFVDGVNGVDGLDGVRSVVGSFDGRFVYAAGYLDDTLAVFARDVATGVLAPLELHRDGFGGEDGLARVSDLAVTSDDQHVYGSGQDDDAVAVYMRDALAPSGPPTLSSTSHTPGVFSNDQTIDVAWSGAADNPGGSGLAGYSIVFDSSALTIPDSVVDVLQAADPHGATSPALPDGTSFAFHIRTCDRAGNCSLTQHLGAYFVDATPPVNPTAILSTSHVLAPGTNTLREITMSWTPATDALAGVSGYSFTFNSSALSACDQVQDAGAATLSTVSDALEDGTWYFHLCARDNAGNWSATATAGPYIIEAAPPRVVVVETVADTPGGSLADGEAVVAPITQLVVVFNEPMADPAGHGDPDDVTNPANYQLIGAGTNGIIQTADCTALGGDDTVRLPVAVSYNAGSLTAVADLGPTSLAREKYRLQVCGSTSILDLAGNPLDGDGNGSGGDDFKLSFEVLSTDLLANPNFDSSVAGWIATPSDPGVVQFDGGEDGDGWPISGSALIEYLNGTPGYAISQCVPVVDNATYVAGGRVRIVSPSFTEPETFVQAQYFGSTNCTVTPLGTEVLGSVVAGDTNELWVDLAEEIQTPPPAARSAYVSFVAQPGVVPDFDASFDRLYFQIYAIVLFADGFESGDTTQWSAQVP